MNAVASGHVHVRPHPHRGEQVVPGQIGDPEQLCLQPEIAPELWQCGAGLLDHDIEDLTVDGAPEKRFVERIRPIASGGERKHLTFDSVERGRDGKRMRLPGAEFRLPGPMSEITVRFHRQIADGAHWEGLCSAVELDLGGNLRREVVVELGPRRARGGRQLRGEGFRLLTHEMPRRHVQLAQRKFVLRR